MSLDTPSSILPTPSPGSPDEEVFREELVGAGAELQTKPFDIELGGQFLPEGGKARKSFAARIADVLLVKESQLSDEEVSKFLDLLDFIQFEGFGQNAGENLREVAEKYQAGVRLDRKEKAILEDAVSGFKVATLTLPEETLVEENFQADGLYPQGIKVHLGKDDYTQLKRVA